MVMNSNYLYGSMNLNYPLNAASTILGKDNVGFRCKLRLTQKVKAANEIRYTSCH